MNTLQAMLLSAALAPAMIKRGWGRIVANAKSMDTMLRGGGLDAGNGQPVTIEQPVGIVR